MAQGGSYVLGVAAILPFHLHLVVLIVIVAAGVAHHLSVSSARQRRLARYGLLALLVVTMWPIGDIAASVSLSVATVQRLVIMLLVAPLLLLSMPTDLLESPHAAGAGRLFRTKSGGTRCGLGRRDRGGDTDVELAGRGLGSALERRTGARHPHRPPRGVFVVDSGLGRSPGHAPPVTGCARGLHLRLRARCHEPVVRVDLLTPSALSRRCITREPCCISRHSSTNSWRGSSRNSAATSPCGG